MRMRSRVIWVIIALAILVLLLPLPIAERYTSPTQDGQYLTKPVRAYQFVIAAVRVSPDSRLSTSGEALREAKQVFGNELRVTKVELLFLPNDQPYSYYTEGGATLTLERPEQFVWEVWGSRAGDGGVSSDVVGLLSYETGELLASVED
jgi:hypothetical protein